jgi:hypothetical protein
MQLFIVLTPSKISHAEMNDKNQSASPKPENKSKFKDDKKTLKMDQKILELMK